MPKAKPISHTKKLLSMCDFYTWLSIFISIFVVTFSSYIIANILLLDGPFRAIYHCFCNVLLTLLSLGPYKFPIAQSGRLLFLFWGLYSVILNTILQGKLINNLNHQMFEKQVSTLDELMASGIKFVIHPELSLAFSSSNNTFDRYVTQNFVTCIEHDDCIDIVTKGLYATTSLRSTIETSETFMPLIYSFKTNVRVDMISMFFNKGFPLFPQMDKYILWLTSTGIVRHLEKSAKMAHSAVNLRKVNNVESNIITFRNLHAIFTIYAVGQALACIVFCIELFYNSFKYKNLQQIFNKSMKW